MIDSERILNDNLIESDNQNIGYGLKIEQDFYSWFNAEYQINHNKIESKYSNQKNEYSQLNQSLKLFIYPTKGQYISLQNHLFNNKIDNQSQQFFFTDLLYNFTWKKHKIDFEFRLNNIFNTTEYRTLIVNDYQIIESKFNLRPRQFLAGLKFSF